MEHALPVQESAAAVAVGRFPDGARILLRKDHRLDFWTHFEAAGAGPRWAGVVRQFEQISGLPIHRVFAADYLEQYFDTDLGRVVVIPVFVIETVCREPDNVNSQSRWCTLDETRKLVPFPNQVLLYEHVWRFFVEQDPAELLEVSMG